MLQSTVDWKLTVAANMGKQALDFLVLQDAMKMSMTQKGLSEQEAGEIIGEVLQAVAEKYQKSDLKSKITVSTTFVPFPGKY